MNIHLFNGSVIEMKQSGGNICACVFLEDGQTLNRLMPCLEWFSGSFPRERKSGKTG
jgi:hypothetical protein